MDGDMEAPGHNCVKEGRFPLLPGVAGVDNKPPQSQCGPSWDAFLNRDAIGPRLGVESFWFKGDKVR